jgi:glutaredoxin
MTVRLLGKPGCHLCEAAERVLAGFTRDFEVVDITTDAALLATYGERIPVLQVDGWEYAAPLSRAVIERALRGHASG